MTVQRFGRRSALRRAAVIGGSALLGVGAGPLLRIDRPRLTHGVSSGVADGGATTIWTRADSGGTMWVELSRRPDFADSWRVRGGKFLPGNDFCAKARVETVPGGGTVHYRVWADDRRAGEPLTGSFRAAPEPGRDVRFVWSADLAGQGWGISADFGGYRIFDDMLAGDPDFFYCGGDFYYGDSVIPETKRLPDGRVWRNRVTEAKSKVAETLDEFRGQFKYNLGDERLRAFLATVPMISQWDDHEVVNDWYPGGRIEDDRYTDKNMDAIARSARRAFAEYTPNPLTPARTGRMYRKISHGPLLDLFVLDFRGNADSGAVSASEGTVLGREQLDWLKRELAASRATWKLLTNSLPLSLILDEGLPRVATLGQGHDGAPRGREADLAELLSFIKKRGIANTVWLATDFHYTGAYHYDPSRAHFTDFTPFWEFMTGPLHAEAYGPYPLDETFGPRVAFEKAPGHDGTGPADGYQFYGEVSIDGESEALTVRLLEIGGNELFRKRLPPE